jgi:hypothetical protein
MNFVVVPKMALKFVLRLSIYTGWAARFANTAADWTTWNDAMR